ncbi:hypothetical protein BsWGS_22074 [Bradybaena similaris]
MPARAIAALLILNLVVVDAVELNGIYLDEKTDDDLVLRSRDLACRIRDQDCARPARCCQGLRCTCIGYHGCAVTKCILVHRPRNSKSSRLLTSWSLIGGVVLMTWALQ